MFRGVYTYTDNGIIDPYGFHIILDRDRSHVKGWGTLSTGEKLYLQTKEGDIGLIIGPISLFTLWSTGPDIFTRKIPVGCVHGSRTDARQSVGSFLMGGHWDRGHIWNCILRNHGKLPRNLGVPLSKGGASHCRPRQISLR